MGDEHHCYAGFLLDSLQLGCVSLSQRFFAPGALRAEAFRAADTDARALLESIAGETAATTGNWFGNL